MDKKCLILITDDFYQDNFIYAQAEEEDKKVKTRAGILVVYPFDTEDEAVGFYSRTKGTIVYPYTIMDYDPSYQYARRFPDNRIVVWK